MNTKMLMPFACFIACAPAAWIAACSSPNSSAPADSGTISEAMDGGAGVAPIDGISSAFLSAFYEGEQAFYSELQLSDGLGPLYTKAGCGDCHAGSARGPGAAAKMVAVGGDGVSPLADQSVLLPFGNTEHPLVVDQIPGVHTPILPPFDGGIDGGPDAGWVTIRVTQRLGPPVFGRGYMEAVEDSEIERMESSQATRSDAIHGHANRLTFASQPNPDQTFDTHQPGDTVIGRFGLKARIATLDEFSADALQGDMGATSPMRTTEFPNPDGVTDDLKPGIDVTAEQMNARGMYVRLIAIPPRAISSFGTLGKAWFENCNCNVCHVESLHTRADYPIPQLADIDAPIYSDLLLHDMGDGLADSVSGEAVAVEGQAGPRDWRTLPLIGLRFSSSYLHDGRAATIDDAIRAHDSPGSQAAVPAQCFEALAPNFQQEMLSFVGSL